MFADFRRSIDMTGVSSHVVVVRRIFLDEKELVHGGLC